MGVNIVKYGNQTLIDLTDTTAVASDVAQGKYFYGKDGVKTEGTATGGGSGEVTQDQDGYVVLDDEEGAQITVEPLSVTQNGTYTAETGHAYSPVTVNVPPEYWVTGQGIPYVRDMYLPTLKLGFRGLFQNATNLETLECNATEKIGNASSSTTVVDYFRGCTSLKSASFPRVSGTATSYIEYFLGECTALKTATFGSVGYPITSFGYTSYAHKLFTGTTQSSLTITLYVDALALADIPAEITTYAPWGATNATIVYRNSTTGEVITS